MSCSCLTLYLTAITQGKAPIGLIPKPAVAHRLVNSAFINSHSQIPTQFGLLSTKLAALQPELCMQVKALERMLIPLS